MLLISRTILVMSCNNRDNLFLFYNRLSQQSFIKRNVIRGGLCRGFNLIISLEKRNLYRVQQVRVCGFVFTNT